MSYLNIYLLLLLFNVLNVIAFGAIVSVAVVNIIARSSPTNMIIYYAYTGILCLALLLSEFRAPRLLGVQMRFLFTYSGRGILLTYFGCIVYTNTLYNIVACVYTVTLGVFYLVIAWVPLVPLQHGIQYNWSRWCSEGVTRLYSTGGHGHKAEQGHGNYALRRKVGRHAISTEQYHDPLLENSGSSEQYVRMGSQATARELNLSNTTYTPEQSPSWPKEMDEMADNANRNKRESSVYGLNAHIRSLDTTGDPYLDKVINSSRFANDMMDPSDDEYVVARDPLFYSRSSGLASSVSGNAKSPTIASSPVYTARRSPTLVANPRSVAPPPQSYTSPLQESFDPGASHISLPIPYHVFAPETRESLHENLEHVSRALNGTTTR
ncbi:hypothetical protein GQ54DRAFT_266034 [Martensiomyces pterosporus]|nr:hypothetical protein GQ54DRAFT_266034 [Martensiomyces pterosporus]